MKIFQTIQIACFLPVLALGNLPKGSPVCSGPSCTSVDLPLGVEPERQPLSQPISTASNETPAPPPQPKTKARPNRERPVPRRQIAENLPSNLPAYYKGHDRSSISPQDGVILVPKSSAPRLSGISIGDVLRAVIPQSIKASPSVPTPIRAIVQRGAMKGSFVLGEAVLDKELKRVLLAFSKLRLPSDEVFSIHATGLSLSGQVGIEGDFHTDTGKFFLAELGAAAAAGLVDATVSRHQTALGTYVQEPSLANSGKQAATAALTRSADKIAERVRQAPEWTETSGFQEIQILVQDEAKEIGG